MRLSKQNPVACGGSIKCVFSVDVEDWFHILDVASTPDITAWDGLPSRVERNFLGLLEIFEQRGARVTCFFLGWVAERFPHLVKEAASRGHEIASHGYAHRLVYQMSPEAFYQDAVRAKKTLEDVAGQAVWGYRAAGFSLTHGTEWFFDKLIEADYVYDSSVFPAQHGHGGLEKGNRKPYWIERVSGRLAEFPVTVAEVFGRPFCFFGGGYLRLFPYNVIRTMTRRVLGEPRPVIFYVHPREIDPDHPRLSMNWRRRFKSYVNLKSTKPKIERLLDEFEITSFERFIRGETAAGKATRAEVMSGLLRTVPTSHMDPGVGLPEGLRQV
jgi:polysaccharide deacetylase family protein (PEP-CTERM system associated)